MYTILLVDDDIGVLSSLENMIDWPVYGIENVLVAHDGHEALSIIRRQRVDLMIADILMPKMSGLELIQFVRKEYASIRCIVLSSYSDFSYAKKAISLGVENYLLKPINKEELENSIKNSIENISMQKQVMQSLFLENLLYRWVTSDISPNELSERAKHVGVNIYCRYYCVILLKPLHKKSLDPLLSAFFAQFTGKHSVYHFMNYDGYHVIILGSHNLSQQFVYDKLSNITRMESSFPEFHAVIGIIASGYELVSSSYQSALEHFLMDHKRTDDPISISHSNEGLDLSGYQLNQILEFVKSDTSLDDEEAFSSLCQDIFPDFSEYTIADIDAYIQLIPIRLALQLTSAGLIDNNYFNIISSNSYHIEYGFSKSDIIDWFKGVISICQTLIKRHTNCLSPIILSVMKYVSDNFSEYVSIKDFCNRYNKNASYLGLLFKKETGIYFNDYVNQTRIIQAIQLLKESNLKVSEISQQVGFTNTSHFIRRFKKWTGVSPVKFRDLYADKK